MFHWRARDLDVPVVVSDSDLADLPEPGWTTFLMDKAFWSKCCSARAWTAQTRRSTTPSTLPPEGYDILVTGLESFGRVLEIGKNVRGLQPADYVVATVKRFRTDIRCLSR